MRKYCYANRNTSLDVTNDREDVGNYYRVKPIKNIAQVTLIKNYKENLGTVRKSRRNYRYRINGSSSSVFSSVVSKKVLS